MQKLKELLIKLYTLSVTRQLASCGVNPLFAPLSRFFISQNISIGDNVFINEQCILVAEEKITIGDNVKIGFGTMLITSNYQPYYNPKSKKRLQYFEPIKVEDNVWIGAAAVILPGVTIGKGSVVGAGAVVTKDVAPHTVVGGVPAKLIKTIEVEMKKKKPSRSKKRTKK